MNNIKIQIICVLLIIITGTAFSDGIIILNPPLRPIHGRHTYIPLSVQSHKVTIRINGNIAVTSIDEKFYNPNNAELEGTFIFPLPEGAAISKFSLFINGVETKGEILDKDKARSIYEGIVRKMKDPALLEYVGRKMFKARVYPIPAHGTRRVKLEYSQTLTADAGLYSYTYPLNTEKFSSQPLQEVIIDVRIQTASALKNIYCPTHEVDIVRKGETTAHISFEKNNVLPDKDFSLFYSVQKGKFGVSLGTYKKGSGDGYFLAMITPAFTDTERYTAKDVVFVFDTSGSMNGEKIEQAKGALKFCLNSLRKEDRFGLVSFSTEARSFRTGLADASKENVKEALAFVDECEARGGTNISEALESALKMCSEEKRPFMIVFMTDGKPTLGIQNEKELISLVKKKNTAGARVFVFGVGYDVNTLILDRIASDSGGTRTYVAPEEDIEIKVSNFFTKVESPALTDVALTIKGSSADNRFNDIYPKHLPDLFRGGQLDVLGRYKGEGDVEIILSGTINGTQKSFTYTANLSGKTEAGEHIPHLWAMRKIYYLLDEIRLHGIKQELKDEVVRLSKEFGIMTPYTSFLVLEDNDKIADSRPRRSVDTAIRRMKKEGYTGPMAAREREEAADAVLGKSTSGRGAFKAARIFSSEKKNKARYNADESVFRGRKGEKYIKIIAGRTFYLNDGTWIDSKYDGEAKTIIIDYMSDEYFEFLKDNPGAGKFFALGKEVIFEYNGTFYEIK